jgi:DNA-directed RNA polymerase specialized sigma24 family protein
VTSNGLHNGIVGLECRLVTDPIFHLIAASAKRRVMGEPEPLDLELLKRLDDDEIRHAIRELGLFSFAEGVVHNVFGSRYPADVRVVAFESLKLLFTRAIRRCRTIDDIRPMLAKIAERQAINFLNVAFRKRRRQFDDESQGPPEGPAAPEVNPFEVLGDILAEGLGLEAFQLPPVVDALVKGAELTEVERHLLIEHIIDGCTQQEFSERHGIPLGGIGGRKTRLVRRVRAFVAGEFTGEMRAEFWQIVRRNEPPTLI